MRFKFHLSIQKINLGQYLKKKSHQIIHPFVTFKNKVLEHLSYKAVGKWLNAIPKWYEVMHFYCLWLQLLLCYVFKVFWDEYDKN